MPKICDASHSFTRPMGPQDFMNDSGKHLAPLRFTSHASLLNLTYLSTRIWEAYSYICHRSVKHATNQGRKPRVHEAHRSSRFHARLWETCDAHVVYILRISIKCDASQHTYLGGIFSRMSQICNACQRSLSQATDSRDP